MDFVFDPSNSVLKEVVHVCYCQLQKGYLFVYRESLQTSQHQLMGLMDPRLQKQVIMVKLQWKPSCQENSQLCGLL